jgi:hypothetical protein
MLIVPGRPSTRSLTFWALSDSEMPPAARLAGAQSGQARVRVLPLASGQDDPIARRLFLVACDGLAPDERYHLEIVRPGVSSEAWSRTLPERLGVGQSFSVALGSCYCVPKNRGIDRCYPPKLHATRQDPIRFRVLAGDQIYMDSDALSGKANLFEAPKPYRRYLQQWDSLLYSSWLKQSPNLVLADDHEFWNDYPHKSVWLTWSESAPGGPLGTRMDRAFGQFQAALNLEARAAIDAGASLPERLGAGARSFQLDVPPLSFFFLDTRTGRTRYDDRPARFCSVSALRAVLAWAGSLRGPGVLAIPQPLVGKPAGALARALHTLPDVNLPDYPADFRALWEALLAAPHDITILTGDIHYTRAYLVSRQPLSRAKIYEVVSSPLARIPMDSDADPTPSGKVELPRGNARWAKLYSAAPEATYTTVSFQPMSGSVQLTVRTWIVGRAGAEMAHQATLSLS